MIEKIKNDTSKWIDTITNMFSEFNEEVNK